MKGVEAVKQGFWFLVSDGNDTLEEREKEGLAVRGEDGSD